MRFFRVCGIIFALLLIAAASPDANQAGTSPPGSEQVEHVPTEDAIAILGHLVEGPDGKTVGRLVDVLVDGAGVPQAGVIDFGGFLGVGTRKVAVHWRTLHFAPAADPKHAVTLDLTPDQIRAAPEYRDTRKPAPVVQPSELPSAPVAKNDPAPTESTLQPARNPQPNGQ